jgi:hypothetical protein
VILREGSPICFLSLYVLRPHCEVQGGQYLLPRGLGWCEAVLALRFDPGEGAPVPDFVNFIATSSVCGAVLRESLAAATGKLSEAAGGRFCIGRIV